MDEWEQIMQLPVLVVFDLDDTLYLERDFARSGFAAAGDWLHWKMGVSNLAETCLTLFAAGRRARIFDVALARLGVEADPVLIGRLVEVYRTHTPRIGLAADARRYFAAYMGSAPCALITDGPSATQRSKVRALGLDKILGCIVYTGALGPDCGKPHPRAFEAVETWAKPYNLPLAYVADNPLKDFVTPRSRGWWTVQIERPDRVHHVAAPDAAHEAHARIVNLDDLDAAFRRLLSTEAKRVRPFPTDASGRIPIS